MQVKVFKFDSNGKISFTQKELEKLLNEVYNGGFEDGKRASNYWYWYPSWYSSNQYANINTMANDRVTLGQDTISGNPKITWTINDDKTVATFKTDNCCEANNAVGD